MAAKKRPTTKRIVDSPAGSRPGTTPGNGRSNSAGSGRNAGGGQRGAAPYTPKQAAKARSRAAAVKAPRRRISGPLIGWISGGLVIVLVVVFVVIYMTRSTPTVAGTGRVTVPASVINEVTNVPISVLDAVGIGGEKATKSSSASNPIAPVPASLVAASTLPPVGGKPTIFYFGAEYCPYCATERWSLIIALSRFGTFTGLEGMESDPNDVYPKTQTWTFYKANYTSKYINFDPVEDEDINRDPLQNPTAAEVKILTKWDYSGGGYSFPFLDIAGKYVGGLPNWLDPQVLQNLSRTEIAEDLSISGNVAGGQLDANANYLSAAICKVDGQQPAAVCTSTGVTAAQAQFKDLATATPTS
jgi:thiol-disulfide isomerase/thioredoxin